MKVAILGATSHIAKGLIVELDSKCELMLFARNTIAVSAFLNSHCAGSKAQVFSLDSFSEISCDGVINCIGLGTPRALAAKNRDIFEITEYFDLLVKNFQQKNLGAISIHLSSGAVYSGAAQLPFSERSEASIAVNEIKEKDFYQIAKLNAEAKHRCRDQDAIVDIRVFGYFSKFIDLNSGYLVTELLNCALSKRVFKTGPENITRDYVGSRDIADLVWKILTGKKQNCAVDIYSRKPVSKSELLSFFQNEFNLEVEILSGTPVASPTGLKPEYYSVNQSAAERFGYTPSGSALEIVSEGCRGLIEML